MVFLGFSWFFSMIGTWTPPGVFFSRQKSDARPARLTWSGITPGRVFASGGRLFRELGSVFVKACFICITVSHLLLYMIVISTYMIVIITYHPVGGLVFRRTSGDLQCFEEKIRNLCVSLILIVNA